MIKIFIFLLMNIVVLLALQLVNIFSMGLKQEESVYPIESGFLSFLSKEMKFSLSFFMLLLLFVLFDVEVIFILFFPISFMSFFSSMLIYLFIFGTLVLEWFWGKLIWF